MSLSSFLGLNDRMRSFVYVAGDINNFIVGSEEGMLYQSCRHGQKAGIGQPFADVGADGHASEHSHHGPVTVGVYGKIKQNGEMRRRG